MSSRKPINRIAICGGGIGGLTLALVISQNCDIFVDIYEAKPEISAIGAPIAIWKRSWQVLQELGLDEDVRKRNIPFPKEGEARGPIFRKSGQKEPGFDFHNHIMPYGPTSLPRPVFLDLLKSRLSDKCVIHTSKKLINYRVVDSQGVTLIFADGSTSSADVLVGADGVHSPTRATMFRELAKTSPEKGYEKFIEPVFSGTFAYRATIDLTKFKALYPDHHALEVPKIWCGKNKHVVSNPFGNMIALICFYTVETSQDTPYDGPWVTEVNADEVINAFEGWEPDLVNLIAQLEKPSRWAIHIVPPIPCCVSGRVAILGDAAHAMTTNQGVGGGQAVEDAHILGHLLSHPKASIEHIEDILQVYQQIRLPVAQKAAERSLDNGLVYEFNHPDYPVHENSSASDLKVLGDAIGESFAWLAEGGCDEDWKGAESLFLARCAA